MIDYKLLIIPDVHGRTFWKDATGRYGDKVENIVFLGDYLDPYPQEGITPEFAFENFRELLAYAQTDDRVTLLLGNHDLHYLYPQDFERCTRYSSDNALKISHELQLTAQPFRMAFATEVGGKKFLLSHAGVTKSWYERNKELIGTLTVEHLNDLRLGGIGFLTLNDLSVYRTWFGGFETGSMVWSDVRERVGAEEDVEGFEYQIFCHTQLADEPIITDTWACIDCRKAFLLTHEGKLQLV